MRLKVSKTKNAASLYVIKSTYENKVNSSKIVESLGTYDELKEKLNDNEVVIEETEEDYSDLKNILFGGPF